MMGIDMDLPAGEHTFRTERHILRIHVPPMRTGMAISIRRSTSHMRPDKDLNVDLDGPHYEIITIWSPQIRENRERRKRLGAGE